MSVRTNMASSSALPERLKVALALRAAATVCPAEVERALAALPFFRKKVGAAGGAGAPRGVAPPSRFGGMGGDDGGGRFSNFRGPSRPAPPPSEDGFETVGRRRGGGGRPTNFHSVFPSTVSRSAPYGGAGGGAGSASSEPLAKPPSPIPADTGVAKFSSAAIRASVDVEDRMLARVKGKINKIGFSTYEQTKVFMQQILSSDETEFLDEIMKFVFSKASTESTFCPLYAKLLHELADEFPHFRVVMHTIFNDYVHVFKEVDAGTEPDPSSVDYKAFVEAQERKRARRGYSQFVAELVKLGEADMNAFAALLSQIVQVIELHHTNAEKTLLCEEYIDCLGNMCKSASSILCKADWAEDLKSRLAVLSAKPRKDVPGLTNKARFALMDLVEYAGRGWK